MAPQRIRILLIINAIISDKNIITFNFELDTSYMQSCHASFTVPKDYTQDTRYEKMDCRSVQKFLKNCFSYKYMKDVQIVSERRFLPNEENSYRMLSQKQFQCLADCSVNHDRNIWKRQNCQNSCLQMVEYVLLSKKDQFLFGKHPE